MRSRIRHYASRSGFTLIELLVVIAIIAILAATTLPMIPGVNDAARIGTCESRLQQVGVALRLYEEDYHAMPRTLETLYTAGYLEQRSLLRCDKAEQEFYYKPQPVNGGREAVIAACTDPATPTGKRPHRYGTVLVELHMHGGITLSR